MIIKQKTYKALAYICCKMQYGLQEKLRDLTNEGYDRKTSLAIVRRHIRENTLITQNNILEDALNAGSKDFNLDWYGLQTAMHTPRTLARLMQGADLVDRVETVVQPKKSKYIGALGKFVRAAGYAATAASVLIAFFSPVYAQDASQPPLDLQIKAWAYEVGGTNYAITLIAPNANSIDTVQNAVNLVGDDTTPAIMLGGNFNDDQINAIKKVITKLFEINPILVSILEPIIIKIQDGSTSGALNNATQDLVGLTQILQKYANKTYGEIDATKDYTEKLDILKGSVVKVPITEEEYNQLLAEIKASHYSTEEGIDIIFSGIVGDSFERTIAHEFGHLIFGESSASYAIFTQLRDSFDLSVIHRDFFSMTYMIQRKGEVDAWVDKKLSEFDAIIQEYNRLSVRERQRAGNELRKLPSDPVTDLKQRTWIALETITPERLISLYKGLLNEAVLTWSLAERIAEDVADILDRNTAYMGSLVQLEEYNSRKAERANIRAEVEAIISEIEAEIQKTSDPNERQDLERDKKLAQGTLDGMIEDDREFIQEPEHIPIENYMKRFGN